MEKELIIKKCLKCGALIKILKDCDCKDCSINCCGEKMFDVKANSVDASFEKHVPTYEKDGNDIIVTVNHVMDEDHYIEWICLVSNHREEYYYMNPGEVAESRFKNVATGVLYSYCNKHGLWKEDIK